MINFIIDKKVDGPNIDLQGYFRDSKESNGHIKLFLSIYLESYMYQNFMTNISLCAIVYYN